VLLRDQAGNVQRQLIANGQLLGQYGRGLDEHKPATDRGDPNFTPVSRFNPSAAGRPEKAGGSMSYVVRAGDSLQAIAQAVYGDGRLWYRIAQATGGCGRRLPFLTDRTPPSSPVQVAPDPVANSKRLRRISTHAIRREARRVRACARLDNHP
jgi:hypothetical protein